MRQTIDAMSTVPVFIQNGRLDAVATNRLGRALFSVMFEDPRAPVNAARFVFLDSRARDFYQDWEANTRQIVAILRAEAGRSPYDRHLSDLVGELSTRSDLFRRLWDHTMYASTAPASRASTTRSSVTSTSRSRAWISPTVASRCWSSRPNPAPLPKTACNYSRTGLTRTARTFSRSPRILTNPDVRWTGARRSPAVLTPSQAAGGGVTRQSRVAGSTRSVAARGAGAVH